jgi:hypothetical protein
MSGHALEALDAMDPARAGELLEFFLHDPSVTDPIEPFAGLLAAMLDRRETALWDRNPAAPREAFLKDLPLEHPECMVCACFPVCRGYGAWAGSCATWDRVLTSLAGAAWDLARLRAGVTPDGSRSGGSHAPDA